MDVLMQNGIHWIVAIQSLGGWLELPMKFFTLLGYENFFFLALPLIYWSVDAGLGLRIALALAFSKQYLKTDFQAAVCGTATLLGQRPGKAFSL
jgi:hypothetical protein